MYAIFPGILRYFFLFPFHFFIQSITNQRPSSSLLTSPRLKLLKRCFFSTPGPFVNYYLNLQRIYTNITSSEFSPEAEDRLLITTLRAGTKTLYIHRLTSTLWTQPMKLYFSLQSILSNNISMPLHFESFSPRIFFSFQLLLISRTCLRPFKFFLLLLHNIRSSVVLVLNQYSLNFTKLDVIIEFLVNWRFGGAHFHSLN